MFEELGDRIKEYESCFSFQIPKKVPFIMRLDGRSFHTITRFMEKPYSKPMMSLMDEVAAILLKDICGAKLGYVQSDEISILVKTNSSRNFSPWLKNKLNKLNSVAAGVASAHFTSLSRKYFNKEVLGVFDCRVSIVPQEDINNYFIWRQMDCQKNSIQSFGRMHLTKSEMFKKNPGEIKEMCLKKGFDYELMPDHFKNGRFIVKKQYIEKAVNKKTNVEQEYVRSKWEPMEITNICIDNPNFINQEI